MLTVLLSSYVPYDSALWAQWWSAIMKTIGAASAVGMVVFTALTVISVFKLVLRFWF